jgi:hypothetical protein
MTRKHYNELAAGIAAVRRDIREDAGENYGNNVAALAAVTLVERELCRVLKADNPRFDRDRFTAAAAGE